MLSKYFIQVSLVVTCLTSYSWLPWSVQGQSQGIYFQLNGVNYSNNSDSEIAITDIGSSDEESLLCFTDNPNCCDGENRMGQWYLPDMTEVRTEGTGDSFYRDRGPSVVRLHRRHNVMMPTGRFCCEIPDIDGVIQRAYIIVSSSKITTSEGNEESVSTSKAPNRPATTTSVTTTATSATTVAISTVATANTVAPEITTTELRVSSTTFSRSTTPTQSPSETPDCSFTEPSGVGIFLNGSWLSNNSIVTLGDIGEGNCALLCYTNLSQCCNGSRRVGEWYFPNKTTVKTRGVDNKDFYRNRGPGVVRLNRRKNAMTPTGIFCCAIPESSHGNFCVGAYNMGDDIGINFTLEGSMLTCSTNPSFIVDSIELLDSDGQIIAGPSRNVSFIHHNLNGKMMNSEYICRVNSTLGSQNKGAFINNNGIEETYTQTDYGTTETNVQSTREVAAKKTPNTQQVIPIAAASGGALLILLGIIFILVCIISRRRKRARRMRKYGTLSATPDGKAQGHSDKLKPEKLELQQVAEESSIPNRSQWQDKPIPLAQFVEHVNQMHSNRDDLFEDEFSSLCTTPQAAHDVSSIPCNDEKNRFLNIFPYDYNRVKLKEITDVEGSDYINASYLNGYYKQKAYIAAQGPLPNSLEDFWRMVWEQKLPTIVMLTKCFEERKKCECYWPENKEESLTLGHDLNITLTSSIPFSDFIIRKMTVKCNLEPDAPPLDVTQLHFTAWPDHGVPSNTSIMLNIIRRVRKIHPYSNPQPLLVHCSAGVGRTGTFIVLDTMLERMKSEKSLNILEFVQQLREERTFMVQSLAQYMFIHDALKELILCGETEILAPNLGIVINKLSKVKDDTTGFEMQFETLKRLFPKLENDAFSCAMTECNVKKNRYPDKLPCDGSSRATLKWNGEQGSDYINASFIDGYKQRRAYIATQGPLESTVNDFWRMVWEQKSCCIVMLCQLEENDKEMSYHFWPTENEPQTFGKLMVKKLSHEKRGDVIMRRFEIDETKQPSLAGLKTAFTVTQFQFLVWKEDETPPITSHLIDVVDNVNKVQMGSGNRPMIVMCNDGIGRTGTFICIHAQLERLKTEGVVDFFQFVKSARIQRPGLILSAGQYELCHTTVLQYLQNVDAYANFKDVV